jgi:hypothetical protein
LMKYHPALCLDPAKPHEFGAVSLQRFIQLCGSLSLIPEHQRNDDFAQIEPVLRTLDQNQTVVFFVQNYQKSGCRHVVRFESIIAGQRIRVMCPYFIAARFEDLDWQDLVAGDVTIVHLTRGP